MGRTLKNQPKTPMNRIGYPPWKLTTRTWKWMAGRWHFLLGCLPGGCYVSCRCIMKLSLFIMPSMLSPKLEGTRFKEMESISFIEGWGRGAMVCSRGYVGNPRLSFKHISPLHLGASCMSRIPKASGNYIWFASRSWLVPPVIVWNDGFCSGIGPATKKMLQESWWSVATWEGGQANQEPSPPQATPSRK